MCLPAASAIFAVADGADHMKSNYKKLIAFAVTGCALFGVAAAQGKSPGQVLKENALGFKENKGQWNPQARFLSQQSGLDYWVTGDGVVIDQYKLTSDKGAIKPVNTSEPYNKVDVFEHLKREGNVVRMSFVGANPLSVTEKGKALPGVTDYFSSAYNQARGVKSYAEAYVSKIYDGIHVRHYTRNGNLRYDIIVDPWHDPRQIEMSFDGIDGKPIVDGRKLSLKTSVGQLNMGDLHVYQPVGNSERVVDAQFVLTTGGRVKIELGQFDPRLPIVIDPLIYGSYVGSPGTATTNADEVVNAIATEANGNLYMTGVTSQVTFPVNAGPYGKFNVQGLDAFLCQMDGNAYTLRYSAVLGGTGTDFGLGVTFNEDSRTLWVGGTTSSTDFAGANNAKGSGSRAWVSKFTFAVDSVVSPQFMTYLNDPGVLTAANFRSLKISAGDTVYVCGNGTASALSGAGYTNYLANNFVGTKKAGFVIALDSNATILYRTMIAGKVDVVQNNMTVTPLDELVLVGFVDFAGVEDTGVVADPSFTTTAGVFSGVTGVFESGRIMQNRSAYVIRLKDDGTGKWACVLGGVGADDARAATLDLDDNVYVTGFTSSFNFQRTPGGFQQDFSTAQVYVTKLKGDASAIDYSTGLRTTGPVTPTSIGVDGRGNCFVGGVVAFTITSPFPGIQIPTIPGSIVTTNRANGDPETAIDPNYNGGDKNVDALNIGAQDGDVPSTTDGFLTVLNPAGSALQYSSYIGEGSDDRVNDVLVDRFGACWVAGYSQVVWNNFLNNGPVPSTPNGIGAHVTANAFKTTMPTNGPGTGQPNYGASNGWIIKHRVVLPRLASLTVSPTSIGGGFGASSTVTVTLQDPAPAGGIITNLTTSNGSASSWDPVGVQLSRNLIFNGGETTQTATIYSFPVLTNQTTSIKVFLDNDFKETRLTVLPWLSDINVSPLTTQGGQDLVVSAILSNVAPAGGADVALSTDRPDLIVLPQPPTVNVPAGSISGQVTVPTKGVASITTVVITSTFLGVSKSKTVTLTPATLKDMTFNPSHVNRGDTSTATVRFFGATGGVRTVTISQTGGDPGAKVNGQNLPLAITVPDQATQFTFTVTSPLASPFGFVRLKADDTVTNVTGTLNIDQIDILDVVLTPGTDVVSGTTINGQVTLTRPAGPGGVRVDLGSTNPNAGTLSATSVTVPAGQTSSPSFQFKCKVVPTDQVTTISASKTGFTTKSRVVTVRGIGLTLTLSPSSVIGG
ncbi:MAG: hypothetical protein JNM34_10530, partial [Chthonomonadaceae bacterium]|nr:hypothetical protein [Chthonomonadaceae bacterium]